MARRFLRRALHVDQQIDPQLEAPRKRDTFLRPVIEVNTVGAFAPEDTDSQDLHWPHSTQS
jgi:hypothetical protein